MRDSYKNSYYKFFTWDKSKSLNKLYTDRIKKKAKEMDSCAQTSEIEITPTIVFKMIREGNNCDCSELEAGLMPSERITSYA